MTTQTLRVAVADDAYTAVSDGHHNVFIRPSTPVTIRLHVGQSAPAAGSPHYLTVTSAGVALSDLEGNDKVYLLAEAEGGEAIVIRGG